MSSAIVKKQPPEIPRKRRGAVPWLENGERLSKAEFLHRYHAAPGLKKAELIGGVVYVGSPVSLEDHATPHAHIVTWLGMYSFATPGVKVSDNPTIDFGAGGVFQPDAVLRLLPEYGGRVREGERSVSTGAPEFVAEVANSSA
ncbi:MAG TPA: Uma2 family endonuclease, partial [Planctomycetia bacterium]|nr:Uma2 family endonuclease [Planctomycetia bacterium]